MLTGAALNNLKVVNDTIGHSADDEFAVLYRRDAEEFVRKLEQKCKVYNLSSIVPVSYAIGYCKLSDNDFMNVADRMMYANKREMKQQR